ncbi:MAG: FAD-dependent oxidoreductase [Verrucomicrobia bacterium]|nr:FAD-dependent oxidoreductase [Verrucomicrobiota bacterium]
MNALKCPLKTVSLAALLLAANLALGDETFDVVVIGGSSGGIGAALGAARLDARVALVEDTPVLGGMLANGISNIDCYSYESLSGAFEEFRRAVQKHYAPLVEKDPFFKPWKKAPNHMDGRSFQANEPRLGGRWEPHVADAIWKAMAAKHPKLKVFYRRFATEVLKNGNRVVGVVTATEKGERLVLRAPVIVDATHEADIAAWAGVPYRVGREARSPLEPHAGQVFFFNNTGEFLPGSNGRQDRAVPSYGLRLCIQNYPADAGDAHILKTPPPGYNPKKFTHASYGGQPSMPNKKSEMNVNPVGNELQQINWVWPEATRVERKRLYETYKNNALAYLYYLQHEKKFTHLGLPKDEFADNGNVPYRIFVREARRIQGEATMTEADVNPFILGRGLEPPSQPTSVGIGHYPIDAKPVRPKTDVTKPDKGDGDFFLVNVAAAFQVPYGAMVPVGVDGLLVPVALSATHVAFSSVRMDPTWTVLGQAAGIAAAMSAKRGIAPRALPVDALQGELVKQKVKLAFFWDVDADRSDFEAIQLLAVRGAARANAERCFRPDDPLTRAEAAVMLYHAFGFWPSVSNAHFTDVPWSHTAFREIETLFDNGVLRALGVEPRWPAAGGYNAGKHAGFTQKHQFGAFEPDKPVTVAELCGMIRIIESRTVSSPGLAGPQIPALAASAGGEAKPLTRGEACRVVWEKLVVGKP